MSLVRIKENDDDMKAAWIGSCPEGEEFMRRFHRFPWCGLSAECGQPGPLNAENTENTEMERRGARFRHASMILDDLPAPVADEPLSQNLNPLLWSSNSLSLTLTSSARQEEWKPNRHCKFHESVMR